MVALAEARALLDQLMGGDRNADLPPGTALPQNQKRAAAQGELWLPSKRSRSCYDKDADPLYCAWGVDVYELFVNTKSDIGSNPYRPSPEARKEFLGLPPHEQERLGFLHMLFHKLGELVSQCDRTVTRNQEKLNRELQRQAHKRGNLDYVVDIDEAAVDQVVRNEIILEEMIADLTKALTELEATKEREDELKAKVVATKQSNQGEAIKTETASPEATTTVKQEDDNNEETITVKKEETDEETAEAPIKNEESEDADGATEKKVKEEENENPTEEPAAEAASVSAAPAPPSKESLALGELLLEKQGLVVKIANILRELGPLQDSIVTQKRQLNHVKSDTTTDKTVCEVSGNFMSARDADERIAAHYAGKQYQGWKLVRDKFAELVKQYGKYGPPPPPRAPGGGGGGGPMMMAPGGGRGGYNDRRGGGREGSYGGRGGGPRGGGGGGYGPPRGGGGGGGRWE